MPIPSRTEAASIRLRISRIPNIDFLSENFCYVTASARCDRCTALFYVILEFPNHARKASDENGARSACLLGSGKPISAIAELGQGIGITLKSEATQEQSG